MSSGLVIFGCLVSECALVDGTTMCFLGPHGFAGLKKPLIVWFQPTVPFLKLAKTAVSSGQRQHLD